MHDVLLPLAWLIIGLMISIGSTSYGLGSWHRPGAGLFPFLVGCTIGLLSFFQLVWRLNKRSGRIEKFRFWSNSEGYKRIGIVLIVLIFYTVALKHLGFILCTFIFFMVMFKRIGNKSWPYTVSASLLISALSYLFFGGWLKINLPRSPFGI